MILSRKWLNEFVDCSAWADHDFSEAMTLSGSKVETFTDLHDTSERRCGPHCGDGAPHKLRPHVGLSGRCGR